MLSAALLAAAQAPALAQPDADAAPRGAAQPPPDARQGAARTAFIDLVTRTRASVVAVGTLQPLRAPHFEFRGTGFAVGDGLTIATNAHVVPSALDADRKESIGIAVPEPNGTARLRAARIWRIDHDTDLALLRIDEGRLPPLILGAAPDAALVQAGTPVALMGFPMGSVLGLFAAVHRGTVAAVTPLLLPPRQARQLDTFAVQRLRRGALRMYQLDAVAFPGNSGSPLFDADTGVVLGVVNQVLVRNAKEGVLPGPSGITYAIPALHLLEMMGEAR